MSERNDITRLNPIKTGVSYVESQDVPSYSSAQYSMPLVIFEDNAPVYKVQGNKGLSDALGAVLADDYKKTDALAKTQNRLNEKEKELAKYKNLKCNPIICDKGNFCMWAGDLVISNGYVEVQSVVQFGAVNSKKNIYICKVNKREWKKSFLIKEENLYENKLLKELERAGLDFVPSLTDGVSKPELIKTLSKYLRDEAKNARQIPYNSGYEANSNQFRYCSSEDAMDLSELSDEIPSLNKYFVGGEISSQSIKKALKIYDACEEKIRDVLIFLAHQPFFSPQLLTEHSWKININSSDNSKRALKNLCLWDSKILVNSFLKSFDKILSSSNSENLCIQIPHVNQYERKCAEKKVANFDKAGVNIILAGEKLSDCIDFDGVLYIPDGINVGEIPDGYYAKFVKWINKCLEPTRGYEDFVEDNDSTIRKEVKLVITGIDNFLKSHDIQMTSEEKDSFVNNVVDFFEKSEGQGLNIVKEFRDAVRNRKFLFYDIQEFYEYDGHTNACFTDEKYLYFENSIFEELIKPMEKVMCKSQICSVLAKEGVLVRERRESDGFYNSVKVRVANSNKRLVKIRREKIFSIIDQNYYCDGSEISGATDPIDSYPCIVLGRREDEDDPAKLLYGGTGKVLKNKHMLITGMSGSGKTYCIGHMLRQVDTAVICFDYAQGFATSGEFSKGKDEEGIMYVDVDSIKIPLFNIRKINGHNENPSVYASRVSGILQCLYGYGRNQTDFIFRCAKDCCEKGEELTFQKISDKESELKESFNVVSKFRRWLDAACFSVEKRNMDWGGIIASGKKVVLCFGRQYTSAEKIFLTEVLMADLLAYCEEQGPSKKEFVLILDEVQRISFSERMSLFRFLTEGRKYGAGVWTATQSLRLIDKSEDRKKLLQASILLQFEPDEEELNELRHENPGKYAKMKKLEIGECLATAKFVRNDGKVTEKITQVVRVAE